jgi:hypothetical protein
MNSEETKPGADLNSSTEIQAAAAYKKGRGAQFNTKKQVHRQ